MKFPCWFSICFLLTSMTLEGGTKYLDKQTFMTIENAEARYGNSPFLPDRFKSASSSERAKMVVNLIKGQKYIGKRPDLVKSELGRFTGHFWNDQIPSYLIDEGWSSKKDTWQVVFLLNDEGLISDVKIHKNCCTK